MFFEQYPIPDALWTIRCVCGCVVSRDLRHGLLRVLHPQRALVDGAAPA